MTPGRDDLGGLIGTFDEWADQRLDQIRGVARVDQLMRWASEAGDFSLIWHVINIARSGSRGRWDQLLALSLALGIESLVLNQGIKRLFRRPRPTVAGDERTPVRQPSTSAFPSGHASAAAFNAVLLSSVEPKGKVIWWALATVVGISRAHVRIHHPSDVVGGAIIGTLLGLLARRILRRISAGLI
jgi:membrane-associated phospholipid phosphatase